MRSRAMVLMAVLAACHVSVSTGPKPSPATANSRTNGAFVGSSPFVLNLDVADIQLKLDASTDSVRWMMYTDPPGCAVASVSSHRIEADDRKNKCTVEWEVTMPAFADVTVDVSVGDIDLNAPNDRAVQVRTGVGDVRVRLDDRLVQHDNAPGSGDRWTIGDMNTRPRLTAKVSVGDVRLDLRTPARAP